MTISVRKGFLYYELLQTLFEHVFSLQLRNVLSGLLWRYVKPKGTFVSVAFDLREYQDILKTFLLV